MKRILVITIAVLLLVVGIAIMPTENADAWSADVRFSPTTTTEGDVVTFHITVENTGSHSMKVTELGIRLDWMEENYYHFTDDVPEVIASGGEHTFDITVSIPKGIPTDTDHALQISVEASDPGWLSEWGSPYSTTYTGSIYINEYVPPPPPPSDTGNNDNGDSSGGSSPFVGAPLLILAVLLAMTMIWVRKRNKTS